MNRFATIPIALALAAVPVTAGVRGAGRAVSTGTILTAPAAAFAVTSAAERAGVRVDILGLAMRATACAAATGEIDRPATLTVIDYSRPSLEPRLWVFDLASGELLFKELVAHGKNTGGNHAERFSNTPDSLQSSIGLFVTRESYVGSNGYSLRLDGLDKGFNDRARERAIVIHGAPYVDAELGVKQGRLGRSWGCPALPLGVARKVIDRIREGGAVFSYYPDPEWLSSSRFLSGCSS